MPILPFFIVFEKIPMKPFSHAFEIAWDGGWGVELISFPVIISYRMSSWVWVAGHVCAEYPEYYELDETKKVFGYFLNSKEQIHMLMKINALKNIDLFLTTQEKKMIKSNQECHFLNVYLRSR